MEDKTGEEFLFRFMDMNDEKWYPFLMWGQALLAIPVFFRLKELPSPHGRHVKSHKRYVRMFAARESWLLMESPALWAMVMFFSLGSHKLERVPQILLRFHQVHYLNRVVIYTIRMRVDGKKTPLIVSLTAFIYNIWNSYLQGRWLSEYGSYTDAWLTSPQFIVGAVMFGIGFAINFWADSVLFSLRSDSHDNSIYRIPRGGLYEYITCPNYFGEIIEWLAWAILTWSPAGLVFFIFTVANLVPRALHHQKWYLSKFNDYPANRKAIMPFLY